MPRKTAVRSKARPAISPMRRVYSARLVVRVLVFAAALWLYVVEGRTAAVLQGWQFFRSFTPLHVLWLVWVSDMLSQIFPPRGYMALGSLKYFGSRYVPDLRRPPDKGEMDAAMKKANRGIGIVFVLWTAVVLGLGALHRAGVLSDTGMLVVVVFFYLCDLICVLYWCPFRVFWMKNRCCTTCRIFNWDHLMMFAPFAFVGGFYGLSLLAMAVLVFVLWEMQVARHPEYFAERSNTALRCANCTDRLCGKR